MVGGEWRGIHVWGREALELALKGAEDQADVEPDGKNGRTVFCLCYAVMYVRSTGRRTR